MVFSLASRLPCIWNQTPPVLFMKITPPTYLMRKGAPPLRENLCFILCKNPGWAQSVVEKILWSWNLGGLYMRPDMKLMPTWNFCRHDIPWYSMPTLGLSLYPVYMITRHRPDMKILLQKIFWNLKKRQGEDIFFRQIFPHNRPRYPINLDHILLPVTYSHHTGACCSIVGYLWVILTYTLVHELRTVPGRNIACVCASLCVCDILMLSSMVAPWCKYVAVLLHFTSLASFFWSTITAFDIWSTFQVCVLLFWPLKFWTS